MILSKSRVQLQRKRLVSEGALGQAVVWEPVGYLHALVIPLNVKTISEYMQLKTEASHRILLRGDIKIDIGSHRFIHGGKIYEPQSSGRYHAGVTEVIVLEVNP